MSDHSNQVGNSEAGESLFFENNPQPMWVYDLDTLRFLAVNKAAVHRYGYSAEEFLEMTILDIRPPEDVAAVRESVCKSRSGTSEFGLWRHCWKGGQIRMVEVSSHSIPFGNRRGQLVMAIDVTERLEIEQEIERQAAFARYNPNPVIELSAEGVPTYFNDATYPLVRALRCSKPEEILPPGVPDIVRRCLNSGQPHLREEYDLGGRTISWSFFPIVPLAIVHCYAGDITERKRHERYLSVLSQLGNNLNRATSAQAAAEIIVEAARNLFGGDAAALDLYSVQNDSILPVLAVVNAGGEYVSCPALPQPAPPTEVARRVLNSGAQLFQGGTSAGVSQQNCQFDGSTGFVCSILAPIRDGTHAVGILSLYSRNSEAFTSADAEGLQVLGDYCGGALTRIQLESRRASLEERFRLISNATSDALWDWDLVTNSLWWSKGFETLFGYEAKEVEGTVESWSSRLHPEEKEKVFESVQQAIAGPGEFWSGEYRFRRQNGTYAYVLDRGHIIRESGGKAIRMVGGMTDLTERRKAEQKLAEQAALLDNAREAIMVRDMADKIIFWNKGAERIFGWTAAEALGQEASALLYKDNQVMKESRAAVLTKGEWQGEVIKITKAKKEIIVDARWTLVRDSRGQPTSILTINSDVTEQKKLEAQFLRTQRMESIGTLAGGIAHDLNNVLAPILMSLELLRDEVRTASGLQMLNTLQTSAERGAELIKQVLSFARGIEGKRVEVNLGHLLGDLSKVMRETFPKGITIRFSSAPDIWAVRGDATQLHQVFLNLGVNARDAMPHGGSLTVTLENVVLDETYAAMNPEGRPGPYVLVNVSDTGTGIQPEFRDKVFEPFFTTKEIGKGTGLGLSTVLAIVKSHGGFINLYSEVGKGTKFKIYLPAIAAAAQVERTAVEKSGLPRGNGELILVVDDEEAVQKIAKRTLERFGYRVLLASNGAEAVSLYAFHSRDIAVVLTDMTMPIMDGPALIVALKAVSPEVRIICSSGLSANGGVAKAIGAGVQHFIPKPYTAETLLQTLYKILHPQ